VDGDLFLHGVNKPVSLTVKEAGEAYTAHTVLKQTDFGIKPIGIGGGMIRVENEIELDFRIDSGRQLRDSSQSAPIASRRIRQNEPKS
jgi:hypothetical protein